MAETKQEKIDIEFSKNEDENRMQLREVETRLQKIAKGGGEKSAAKQKEKGKLLARERIEYLLDKDSPFFEIGAFAGFEMYEAEGGCPSGGVVAGTGYVAGRLCMVVANDATVKAGAWFPITAKKNLRAQEIAMENRLPIIYLVDSAGVYLPMQDEIFPDKEHFGRMFRNNAIMSSEGIIQIAAIMGSCVAGGAYLPIMSDEALIVDKTGSIFLAGPYLVKAAIGEDIDQETLGGATTQSEISGVTDNKFPDDKSALDYIRKMMDKIGDFEKAGATYVSPFMGRLDDISFDGIQLIQQIVDIFSNYAIETEVLAASVRSTLHIVQCAQIGADVVTVPSNVILQMLNHPLTDIGLEKFLADHRKLNDNI